MTILAGTVSATGRAVVGENTAEARRQAALAAGGAASAALAQTAVSAAARYFPSQTAGEAGSAAGQFFSHPDGTGGLSYRERTAGGSTLIASAATKAQIDQFKAGGGADLIGYTADGSAQATTVRDKLRHIRSVLDHMPTADGVADDVGAFEAALAAAADGARIAVPAGTYHLSRQPDPVTTRTEGGILHNVRDKYVTWDVEPGATFSGAGVGAPDANGLKYLSPITNPYVQIFGSYHQMDLRGHATLNGNCLIGEATELAENFGYARTFTGNLVAGQATIAATSIDLRTLVKQGDLIESSVAGWPQPGTARMRVWAVSATTVTFGIDAGAGPAGPTAWAGSSASGVSFTIYAREWMAMFYRGITTGGPGSKDMAYGITNDVINLTGGPANAYEIDIIALANPGSYSRGIFGTGHGDAAATLTFMDIQRAGPTPWACGIAMRHAEVGLFMNARNPLSIDAEYLDPRTGAAAPINFALHLNNAPAILGAIIEGRQITNGAPAIALWRNTDTSPTGDFLALYEAGTGKKNAFIDVTGGAHFTTLQLDQVPIATSDTPISGYMTIQANNGVFYKVAIIGAA